MEIGDWSGEIGDWRLGARKKILGARRGVATIARSPGRYIAGRTPSAPRYIRVASVREVHFALLIRMLSATQPLHDPAFM